MDRIRSLTENSGGILFQTDGPSAIGSAFELIAEEFKSQYLLGTVVSPNIDEKKWRKLLISVDLSDAELKNHGKVTVKATDGYFTK